jgi:hypothetical protein
MTNDDWSAEETDDPFYAWPGETSTRLRSEQVTVSGSFAGVNPT